MAEEISSAASQPANLSLLSRGLQLLSITQLRQLLREYSLPTGGNKEALVSRFIMYLETFGSFQHNLLPQFSVRLRKLLSAEVGAAEQPPPRGEPNGEAVPEGITERILSSVPSCLFEISPEPPIFGPVVIQNPHPSPVFAIPQVAQVPDSVPFLQFLPLTDEGVLKKVVLTFEEEYFSVAEPVFWHSFPDIISRSGSLQVQSTDPSGPLVIVIRWFRRIPVDEIVRHILARENAAAGQETLHKETGICPLTRKIITCPVRGSKCEHSDCFDLVGYLAYGAKGNIWICPVCHKPAQPDELRVDPGFFFRTRAC
jgi:hypothetical protein